MVVNTDWVVAIASCIAACGVVFVAIQARMAQKALKADHERSRRDNSIKLLMHMDISRQRQSSIARKFAESLDFKQSKSLLNQESFSIKKEYKDLLLGSISKDSELHNTINDDPDINIPVSDCADIRWQVVSYLNNLESILAAWRHNVADKDILEEQYHFLVSPQDGHYLLKEFREAAGGAKHFPSIEDFVLHIQKKFESGNGKNKIA